MSPRVANIVVTCTKRKSVAADDRLQLGCISGSTVSQLAKNWIAQLKKVRSQLLPADELYSGDHWRIAQSLPEIANTQKIKVRLWVCSAGYGLIPAGAPVKPYSATFSSHHKDSVLQRLRFLDGNVHEWWSHLANWSGPVPGEPRTLLDLAQDAKRSPLIIVASDVYLRAIGPDLENAKNALADPKLLTIVSGGGPASGHLKSHFIPCNARLQSLLGGALMSLNVRVVRRILSRAERWPLRCDALVKEFGELVAAQPVFEQPQRKPMSDDRVRQFILRRMTRNPSLSATPLLREFRDSGFACEQKRFGKLFLQVRKQFHE